MKSQCKLPFWRIRSYLQLEKFQRSTLLLKQNPNYCCFVAYVLVEIILNGPQDSVFPETARYGCICYSIYMCVMCSVCMFSLGGCLVSLRTQFIIIVFKIASIILTLWTVVQTCYYLLVFEVGPCLGDLPFRSLILSIFVDFAEWVFKWRPRCTRIWFVIVVDTDDILVYVWKKC